MLLREIQVLIRAHLSGLAPQFEELGGGKQNFLNRETVRNAVVVLQTIDYLKDRAARVSALASFHTPTTVTEKKSAEEVQAAVRDLMTASMAVMMFLDSVLPSPAPFYLSVRLPPGSDSHTDLAAKAINAVHAALDHPVRRLGFDPLTIGLVQPGSFWIEVVHNHADAFALVGAILTVAMAYVKLREANIMRDTEKVKLEGEKSKVEQEKHKVEQEKHKAEAERSRAEQEAIKRDMARAERNLKEMEIDVQRQRLRTESLMAQLLEKGDGSAETESMLEHCVKFAEDLVHDGASFRLQLDAPQSIVEQFPPEAIPERLGVPQKRIATQEAPRQLPPRSDLQEKS